jgi:hypothetical protein
MDSWYNARSREFDNINAKMFIRHRVQPHVELGKPRQNVGLEWIDSDVFLKRLKAFRGHDEG